MQNVIRKPASDGERESRGKLIKKIENLIIIKHGKRCLADRMNEFFILSFAECCNVNDGIN